VGSPEIFDLRREYRFPPFAAAKVSFCGYIARQLGQRSRSQARAELKVGRSEALVLVTPGGGEDGHQLIKAALDGLSLLPAAQRPRMHIVCGPEMAEAERTSVHHRAAQLAAVSVQDFSDDMMSLMAAADVVVAMGGYNTVCELLTLRKRAVIVPRIKPSLEQCIRAERMSALGLLRMLHPQRLTPAVLLDLVQSELAALSSPTTHSHLRAMTGLEHSSAAILELIGLSPSPAHSSCTAPSAQPAVSTHHSDRPSAQSSSWNTHASITATPLAC
jgi:predicted glycosyltransferase